MRLTVAGLMVLTTLKTVQVMCVRAILGFLRVVEQSIIFQVRFRGFRISCS